MKATQEFNKDRKTMGTPPMVRDMHKRQENYDNVTKNQIMAAST